MLKSFLIKYGRKAGLNKSWLAKKLFKKYIQIQMRNLKGIHPKTVQGFTLLIDHDDPIGKEDIFLSDIQSQPVTSCFYNEIRPGMIVFDIGANIGYFTMLSSQLNRNATVIAFEPNKKNCNLIRESVTINNFSNVVIIEKAVSNTEGKGKLFLNPFASVDDKIIDSDENRSFTDIELQSIDDFIETTSFVPNFIKIDVQGAEYYVLEGMKKLLNSVSPLKLVIEFSPRNNTLTYGKFKKVLLNLKKNNFHCYFLKEQTKLKKISKKEEYENDIKIPILDLDTLPFSNDDEVDLLFVRNT